MLCMRIKSVLQVGMVLCMHTKGQGALFEARSESEEYLIAGTG